MAIKIEINSYLGFCELDMSNKVKYFPRQTSFWSMSLSSNASWLTKGIISIREFLRSETCYLVGNGMLVDIWHAPWISWLDWEHYQDAFNPRVQCRGITLHSTLLNHVGLWSFEALKAWFILSLVGSMMRAYHGLIKSRGNNVSPMWKKSRRRLFMRGGFFMWKVGRDILPFGIRLRQIFSSNVNCAICNSHDDSYQHLFFHCLLAHHLWFSSPWAIRSDILLFNYPPLERWIVNPKRSSVTALREPFGREVVEAMVVKLIGDSALGRGQRK
ncbi:hypothetical protein F8388_021873 [Cannabis sativa]|uniref:Reverse transcriptase zinc-binding domain-containing protein n=1 Tax=Cannabis sativa TaxID=3483 RepID=A0A7J6ELV5_CANSA|nr:hypothetical protein F8388_021873 [Cannabis sativa]